MTVAFFTVLLFAEEDKAEKKADETSSKLVARGVTTIQTSDPTIAKGNFDKKVIEEHVRKILPKIRYCYENGLVKNYEINGRIVAEFVIQTN